MAKEDGTVFFIIGGTLSAIGLLLIILNFNVQPPVIVQQPAAVPTSGGSVNTAQLEQLATLLV